MYRFFTRTALFAALGLAATGAHAEWTIHESLTPLILNGVVDSPQSEGFSGFYGSVLPSPVWRDWGYHNYNISARSLDGMFAPIVGPAAGRPWITTLGATDSITFSDFTADNPLAPARIFAGSFHGWNGVMGVGRVELIAVDSYGSVLTQVLNNVSPIRAFQTDGTIVSITVRGLQPQTGATWPAVENLFLASALAVVPEPPATALMLIGAALVAMRARRSALPAGARHPRRR